MTPAIGFAVAGLVVSLVGTGVSYYQQNESAKAQTAIGAFNRRAQQEQANLVLQSQTLQAQGEQKLLEQQAAQQSINAQVIRQSAEDEAAQQRAGAEIKRQEGQRLQSRQRAAIAKSGLVETGTPLDILAETAGQLQHAQELELYEQNVSRERAYRQASLVETGASGTRFEAEMAGLGSSAARVQYGTDILQSNLDYLNSGMKASATSMGATSSLLTGVGGYTMDSAYRWNNMPKSTYRNPASPTPLY